jgi:hypothetical protein
MGVSNVRSMPEPTPVPTLADAQALIERLRPKDRAMLRPWVLARFNVSGDLEQAVRDREEPPHRLRGG